MKTRSVVASLALVGALTFIGCGGGGSSSVAGVTSTQILDALKSSQLTKQDLQKAKYIAVVGNTEQEVTLDNLPESLDYLKIVVGDRAYYVKVTKNEHGEYVVEPYNPSKDGQALAAYRLNANVTMVGEENKTCITEDNKGKFSCERPQGFRYLVVTGGRNSETNTSITVPFRAPRDSEFVSALTTLVVDEKGEVNETLYRDMKDIINIDYNIPKQDNLDNVKKAIVLKSVAEVVLSDDNKTAIDKLKKKALEVAKASEVNETVVEELVKDLNTTVPTLNDIINNLKVIVEEDNATKIEKQLEEVEESVAKAATKLGVKYIQLGSLKVEPTDYKTFDIHVTNNSNLTNFYNVAIKINTNDIAYAFDKETSYRATVTITVKQEDAQEDRNLTLQVQDANITFGDGSENNVTVEFDRSTKVCMSEKGLSKIANILGKEDVCKSITTSLTNHDLSFNVETITSALDANGTKIQDALDALNNYFQQEGIYSVTLKINADELNEKLATTQITGTVRVGEVASSSSQASSEISSSESSSEVSSSESSSQMSSSSETNKKEFLFNEMQDTANPPSYIKVEKLNGDSNAFKIEVNENDIPNEPSLAAPNGTVEVKDANGDLLFVVTFNPAWNGKEATIVYNGQEQTITVDTDQGNEVTF